jgi:hypothetical protein
MVRDGYECCLVLASGSRRIQYEHMQDVIRPLFVITVPRRPGVGTLVAKFVFQLPSARFEQCFRKNRQRDYQSVDARCKGIGGDERGDRDKPRVF